MMSLKEFLKEKIKICFRCSGDDYKEFEIGGFFYRLCSECAKDEKVKAFFIERYNADIEKIFKEEEMRVTICSFEKEGKRYSAVLKGEVILSECLSFNIMSPYHEHIILGKVKDDDWYCVYSSYCCEEHSGEFKEWVKKWFPQIEYELGRFLFKYQNIVWLDEQTGAKLKYPLTGFEKPIEE